MKLWKYEGLGKIICSKSFFYMESMCVCVCMCAYHSMKRSEESWDLGSQKGDALLHRSLWNTALRPPLAFVQRRKLEQIETFIHKQEPASLRKKNKTKQNKNTLNN